MLFNAISSCWDELELSEKQSVNKCIDAAKLEKYIYIPEDKLSIKIPVINITGDWKPIDSEPFQLTQSGLSIKTKHYNNTYSHDGSGTFVDSKKINVKIIRLFKPTNCATAINSIWNVIDENTIAIQTTGTDGKCDLPQNYTPYSVISKIYLPDISGVWTAPNGSTLQLKKIGANVTGVADDHNYNHRTEALFVSQTEAHVAMWRLHKPSNCTTVMNIRWTIPTPNEILYTVIGTDGKCDLPASYTETGRLHR